MKAILAAAGAFGQKHLDAVKAIGGIEIDTSLGASWTGHRAIVSTAAAQPAAQAGVLSASRMSGPFDSTR